VKYISNHLRGWPPHLLLCNIFTITIKNKEYLSPWERKYPN
jgi:hypothetical protein